LPHLLSAFKESNAKAPKRWGRPIGEKIPLDIIHKKSKIILMSEGVAARLNFPIHGSRRLFLSLPYETGQDITKRSFLYEEHY